MLWQKYCWHLFVNALVSCIPSWASSSYYLFVWMVLIIITLPKWVTSPNTWSFSICLLNTIWSKLIKYQIPISSLFFFKWGKFMKKKNHLIKQNRLVSVLSSASFWAIWFCVFVIVFELYNSLSYRKNTDSTVNDTCPYKCKWVLSSEYSWSLPCWYWPVLHLFTNSFQYSWSPVCYLNSPSNQL